MDNDTTGNLDILDEINLSLLQAKIILNESSDERFTRNLLQLIQREIQKATNSALCWKFIRSDVHEYTHTGNFPLAVYNELSEEFLTMLESKDIYIFCNAAKKHHATIKIILHF